MLDRFKLWIKANPWRLAAIVLGVALVVAVAVLALARDGDGEPVAAPSTTLGVLDPADTTLEGDEGPSLGLDPSGSGEGLGASYV